MVTPQDLGYTNDPFETAKFLTPLQYQTADWTVFDDIRFFTENPELCKQIDLEIE